MAFRTRKPSNQVAPPQERQQNSSPSPLQNPNYHPDDFFTLCNILKDPNIQPGRPYKSHRTGIEPELGLIQAVFDHFNPSSKWLHCVFRWAEKKPGFQSSAELFNSMENLLGKEREFDSACCLLLDKISGN